MAGRAGLALFVACLHGIELYKQVLCFFVDGTSPRLTYFDQICQDEGYVDSIETGQADMASSHQIKRFLEAFAWTRVFLFRRLLQTLFIWRLQITQPDVIELGIDTMVMDNDDAELSQLSDNRHRSLKVMPRTKGLLRPKTAKFWA